MIYQTLSGGTRLPTGKQAFVRVYWNNQECLPVGRPECSTSRNILPAEFYLHYRLCDCKGDRIMHHIAIVIQSEKCIDGFMKSIFREDQCVLIG